MHSDEWPSVRKMPDGRARVNHRTAPTGRRAAFVPSLITLSDTRSRAAFLEQISMRSVSLPFVVSLSVLLGGCGGGTPASTPTTAPAPERHPLAALAATGAIVAPAAMLHIAPELSWSSPQSNARDLLRALDDDIAAALADRGLKTNWVMPADLAISYKRNPTYATDPYALAEESLRSSAFTAGTRLQEPLASQLRTMIALHENARAVLLPVELRFERADATSSAGTARATLRLALVDPRFSEARWVGTVTSDTTSADARALTRALARGVADLIVSRQ